MDFNLVFSDVVELKSLIDCRIIELKKFVSSSKSLGFDTSLYDFQLKEISKLEKLLEKLDNLRY